tara:strand:+ start:107941 stop:108375 length:435 start_codon:yes stop_codon:yes gene_type:complete
MSGENKLQRKVERRVLPRCPLATTVELEINSQGENRLFKTESINISLRGIELACDDALIQAILAQNVYPHACKIKFNMPGHSKMFELKTQVVTHRRLSQHNYQLILVFNDISKRTHEKLLDELATFRIVAMNNAEKNQRTAIAI